jgi:hypothetical protein
VETALDVPVGDDNALTAEADALALPLDDLTPVLLTCAFPEPKPGNLRRLPPPEPLPGAAGDLRLLPPPVELLADTAGADADAEAAPLRPLLAELAELLAMAEAEDADAVAAPLRPLPPVPLPVPTDEAEAEAVG